MRRHRQVLSGAELAALERSVGIEPLSESRQLTIRRERSPWVDNVLSLPEGGQIVLSVIALGLTALVVVVTIMVFSTVLQGPPDSCALHGGALAVRVGNDNTTWSGMVVCRDGSSYTN